MNKQAGRALLFWTVMFIITNVLMFLVFYLVSDNKHIMLWSQSVKNAYVFLLSIISIVYIVAIGYNTYNYLELD